MNDISTANLVKELETREGVEVIIAEPYDNKTITVEGPAVVLAFTKGRIPCIVKHKQSSKTIRYSVSSRLENILKDLSEEGD